MPNRYRIGLEYIIVREMKNNAKSVKDRFGIDYCT